MQRHRPRQITPDGSVIYFISARTYSGIPYIFGDIRKKKFQEILFGKTDKFSAKLIHYVILNNHYHLLIEFDNGLALPKFTQELHGASSFEIKKLPIAEVLNEEQIYFRGRTPMEERTENRITKFWQELRRLPPSLKLRRAGKPARTEAERRLKSATTEIKEDVIAHFSARLIEIGNRLNFSKITISRLTSSLMIKNFHKALERDDFLLFKLLVLVQLPEIPFWCNYYSHIIRNDKDYFSHFNYISQNPIKHKIVKNLWDYRFSGVFCYNREYIIDSLRDYPIVDFGGCFE